MAYDEIQENVDRNPPFRRSVDDEERESNLERRSYQPPQPPAGGCSKGCLYGMAGCGCLTVILAIVAGVVGWRFFSKAFSDNPIVVTATAKEIADFELPPDLKPAVKIDFWFAKFVVFGNEKGDSTLILTELDLKKMPNPKGHAPDFDINKEGGHRRLEILKSELREMKIRGEMGKVTFSEAKDLDSGVEYRVVKGRFNGKNGPAQFELQRPKEQFKEADVLKFIDGIK